MNEELIRKTVQKEIINGIKKELDSTLIFTYIHSLEQENKKLHNKIDKAIEYIETSSLEVNIKDYGMVTVCNSDDVLEILKESDIDE